MKKSSRDSAGVKPARDPAPSRAEIVGAAVAAFSRHGYRDPDLERVARRLKMAKGIVHHCFGFRQALFTAVLAAGAG